MALNELILSACIAAHDGQRKMVSWWTQQQPRGEERQGLRLESLNVWDRDQVKPVSPGRENPWKKRGFLRAQGTQGIWNKAQKVGCSWDLTGAGSPLLKDGGQSSGPLTTLNVLSGAEAGESEEMGLYVSTSYHPVHVLSQVTSLSLVSQ